ncbi:hypothetical protein KIL84_000311 [Mauremys mutica]|uniref:Uncharacterized protein n=1 Tax=Mauremys mutica TaxID=74926 RepID=A0A9D4B3L3_9SAUR|nr:hypothetical protein KIL84_000311 [Mauremys mutica]
MNLNMATQSGSRSGLEHSNPVTRNPHAGMGSKHSELVPAMQPIALQRNSVLELNWNTPTRSQPHDQQHGNTHLCWNWTRTKLHGHSHNMATQSRIGTAPEHGRCREDSLLLTALCFQGRGRN